MAAISARIDAISATRRSAYVVGASTVGFGPRKNMTVRIVRLRQMAEKIRRNVSSPMYQKWSAVLDMMTRRPEMMTRLRGGLREFEDCDILSRLAGIDNRTKTRR